MKITLNGEPQKIHSGSSIMDLLSQFNIGNPMTIIEVNEQVVPKENWSNHQIIESDQIEIIQLMGGG